MQSYDVFSLFYDRLTFNINYNKQAEYILRLFDMYSDKPQTLLDLGCGTGSLTIELAKKDIKMIGVDMSCGMLNAATQKLDGQELDVMFVCQRIQSLDMPGLFDGAVCTLDTINHLRGAQAVQKAFDRASMFIRPGGLFIFDVNTPYKHRNVLGNNTFIYDLDDIFCAWQNEYDDAKCRVNISLDFFEKCGRTYRRSKERFCEYAYSDEQLAAMLNEAGFDTLNVYSELTFDSPADDCQRKVYVTRRMED